MSRKNGKHKHDREADDRNVGPREDSAAGDSGDAPIHTGGWQESQRSLTWQSFPVPGQVSEALRVALTRDAYADIVSHAKESLSAEVCGVLAGEFCEDEHGMYVSVQAVVRGTSVEHGAAHVTYTQETWNQIHKTMESDHPDLRIVGWYHSHPGFGVEFSDMDLFIQENFFAGQGQVAFITDPLGGDEALCANTQDGLAHLGRFWVDGRERRCHVQVSCGSAESRGDGAGGGADLAKSLRAVENRLGQALQAVEELRTTYYRFLMFIGTTVALGVIFLIASTIYSHYSATMEPPKLRSYDMRVPVPIEGRMHWFGINVVGWEQPEEFQEAIMQAAKQQLLEEQEKARQLQEEMQKQENQSGGSGGSTQQPAATDGASSTGPNPAGDVTPAVGGDKKGDAP